MNLRQILELTEKDIDELEYHENRLRVALERVRTELNAKKHAAEEIRRELEATRK